MSSVLVFDCGKNKAMHLFLQITAVEYVQQRVNIYSLLSFEGSIRAENVSAVRLINRCTMSEVSQTCVIVLLFCSFTKIFSCDLYEGKCWSCSYVDAYAVNVYP